MVGSTIEREIHGYLDRMPVTLQREVMDFARSLAGAERRKVPGKDLLQFAGAIDAEDLALMSQAIDAGCERTDRSGWR